MRSLRKARNLAPNESARHTYPPPGRQHDAGPGLSGWIALSGADAAAWAVAPMMEKRQKMMARTLTRAPPRGRSASPG